MVKQLVRVPSPGVRVPRTRMLPQQPQAHTPAPQQCVTVEVTRALKPLYCSVGWKVTDKGNITGGQLRKGGQDALEAGASVGGMTLTEADASWTGGQLPGRQSAKITGIVVIPMATSGALTDAQQQTLLNNIVLTLKVGEVEHALGPAYDWRERDSGYRQFHETVEIPGTTTLQIQARTARSIPGMPPKEEVRLRFLLVGSRTFR